MGWPSKVQLLSSPGRRSLVQQVERRTETCILVHSPGASDTCCFWGTLAGDPWISPIALCGFLPQLCWTVTAEPFQPLQTSPGSSPWDLFPTPGPFKMPGPSLRGEAGTTE